MLLWEFTDAYAGRPCGRDAFPGGILNVRETLAALRAPRRRGRGRSRTPPSLLTSRSRIDRDASPSGAVQIPRSVHWEAVTSTGGGKAASSLSGRGVVGRSNRPRDP